ncbi:Ubiquitinyl hydrolase 1 protein, partial [Dioscorea alata]
GCNLYNVGTTCYLNVVLQCLTHTVPLVNALINFGDCKLCSHQVKDHINMAIYFNGISFTPGVFIRNLTDISSLFAEDEQQDAHEYLLGLLTRMHECCLGLPASSLNTSLEDESLITNIFCGRLKSQITCCECGHKSETFEPVLNLSLEIDGQNNLISALQSFTRVEKIDDPENLISCDGCKTKVIVEKQLTINKAPEVLVIQLKRFTCDGMTIVKKEQYVQYPETLNLAPFIDEFIEQEQELNYRLYAVVNHHGLPWDGHYMCFIHSHGQRWFLKNDCR